MDATTIRLDDEDEAIPDMLAPECHGRSSAIRHALLTAAARPEAAEVRPLQGTSR